MFTMHQRSIGRTNYELLCFDRNAADYVLTLKLEILKITVDTCLNVNLE